jgi:phosphoglycerate dehydrogenase-like enzyme
VRPVSAENSATGFDLEVSHSSDKLVPRQNPIPACDLRLSGVDQATRLYSLMTMLVNSRNAGEGCTAATTPWQSSLPDRWVIPPGNQQVSVSNRGCEADRSTMLIDAYRGCSSSAVPRLGRLLVVLYDRPVLTVLCGSGGGRPPHMQSVEQRMTVRYTDAGGLATAVHGADALFLWDYFSTAVRDVWAQADSLSWIHVAAAGVDKLMFEELTQSEVTVTNARGVFDRPIAEFVLASLLAHAKDLHHSHDLQLARVWKYRETFTLAGTTALVVGTGAIGREIARLLRVVGVQVRGAGRSAREGDPDFGTVIASGELADQVGWADAVVVIAPLTEQTRGLIDAKILKAMKPSAYLVNVGRGPCVVEADLLAALESGQIAGAALDVFENEPLATEHPLWSAPGVTVSPHMSGDAIGWLDTVAHQFVDNALRWLDGEPLLNVVDKRLGFVPAVEPLVFRTSE